jgi:nitrile hydratase
MARRVAEFERLLIAAGVLGAEQVDDVEDVFGHRMGARNGARYVARAWRDPDFRHRLLDDATEVVRAEGYDLRGGTNVELPFLALVVVENTRKVHNLVVCTLCSCYPRSVLGSPPAWYVGKAYRARAVREPRKVLAEFGLALSDEVRVRVHDSTANMRYLVLPMRPAGTGSWEEERLKTLVTRDSLIGVARARDPREIDAPA